MKSPISFWEICKFKHLLLRNMALYSLGVLPSVFSVLIIKYIGKKKGFI